LACDVNDTARFRSELACLSNLDVLVNNAGMNIPEPFVDVCEGHLDQILTLDVRAAFLVAQMAMRKMLEAPDRRERGGSVINVSSQMGHVGASGRTVYCMCKHAIEGLTKAMAVELGPNNIRVNPKKGGAPFLVKGRTMLVLIRYDQSPTGWATLREIVQPGPEGE
jgi:NAD(P)-dependent dehydrogenase (short-subunit alcohol dehydrogenase family)